MAKKKFYDENGNEVKAKEKKPFYKKWWFWLIIVIVVGGGALGGGAEEATETEPTETAAPAEETTSETEEADTTETSAEEEVEEPADELLSVGDSVTIDDVTMTVNSVEYTDERNEFDDTNPENVIKISYTLENGASEDYPYGADFQVYADGSLMETYPNDNSMGSVSAGRSVEGVAHFGVNGEEIEIEWAPLFSMSGEKGVWAVDPQ